MDITVITRDLSLPLAEASEPEEALRRRVADRFQVRAETLPQPTIVRRALDTRRRNPRYIYNVSLTLEPRLGERVVAAGWAEPLRPPERHRWVLPQRPDGPPPVVVGAGPAGLFAALTLAEAGWPPVLLERGRPVSLRAKDVSALYARGELDPESNVCFGEGGAGAFSDGKLHTRVKDPRVHQFMDTLVQLGAEPGIRIDNRPHIGTDRLVRVIEAMRQRLEDLGCVIHFETRMERLEISDGELVAARTAAGERWDTPRLILATGHSARDVMAGLEAAGLTLEARPFAVGFRVEHPQEKIDELRYGRFAGDPLLPAADYRLSHNEGEGDAHRGIYSFCVCPGGVVVATPTRAEELCVNGMSHKARSGRFANGGIVVSVGPSDFAAAGHDGVFAGVRFQEQVERAAYAAGGGEFRAPAARLADFVAGEPSTALGQSELSSVRSPPSSYRRGLQPAELDRLYPAPLIEALRRGLAAFDRTLPGFVTNDATLIGVETRTASPLRLPRTEDLEAVGARGLYPCGEGLGYGGGIASAAVDGMRAAEAMLAAAGAHRELIPG